MAIEYVIAQSSDINRVFSFAEKQFEKIYPDEMDRMIQIWNSKFRTEALEHYLKLGWSFLAIEEKEIKGFFLAQPLLFLNGKTQTLWIEEVMADSLSIRQELIDIAYKLAKDKHLQGVLISQQFESDLTKKNIKFEFQNEEHLWLKTTK